MFAGAVARRRGESRGDNVGSAGAAHNTSKKSKPYGSTTPLTVTRGSSRSANLQASAFPQPSLNSATPFGWLMEDSWEAGLSDVDMLALETPLLVDQSIDPLLYPFSEGPSMVEDSISTFIPWDLSGPSPFGRRAFPRSNQAPLVSLAKQILGSYPFMMLQKADLPPFISPLQFSWAESGVVPPQQVS